MLTRCLHVRLCCKPWPHSPWSVFLTSRRFFVIFGEPFYIIKEDEISLDMTGHCDKSVHTLLCKKNAIFSGIILRKDDWSESVRQMTLFSFWTTKLEISWLAAARSWNRKVSKFCKIVNYAKRTTCVCLLFFSALFSSSCPGRWFCVWW